MCDDVDNGRRERKAKKNARKKSFCSKNAFVTRVTHSLRVSVRMNSREPRHKKEKNTKELRTNTLAHMFVSAFTKEGHFFGVSVACSPAAVRLNRSEMRTNKIEVLLLQR